MLYLAAGVPADPETVAVGRGLALQRLAALADQRILRLEDQRVEVDGHTAVGQPAAHGETPGELSNLVVSFFFVSMNKFRSCPTNFKNSYLFVWYKFENFL